MIYDDIEYFAYTELRPIALKTLKDKLLKSGIKYFFDINTAYDNKVIIGRCKKRNGYLKRVIRIEDI